jgi:hypothetical protein
MCQQLSCAASLAASVRAASAFVRHTPGLNPAGMLQYRGIQIPHPSVISRSPTTGDTISERIECVRAKQPSSVPAFGTARAATPGHHSHRECELAHTGRRQIAAGPGITHQWPVSA